MSKTAHMRGLQNFIQDIRGAQNKEQEQRRVDKELAKIREKFVDDRSLSGYDRRKYVWKLLYIHMLGYSIEFGHKQAADLIPLPKYKDKQVGYMACSLLLRENDEFLRLTMNAIRLDLLSRNEAFETLALSFIGSVGGTEMADALTQDVIKLLSSGTARPLVKKRAALVLLRLIRKSPPDSPVVTPDTFAPILNTLLDERDLGLLLSTVTLLQGISARNTSVGYEGAQPRLIKILERLTMQREKDVPAEYQYYGIPSPWLQCKCLRVLQFFPPPETPAERATLGAILQGIIQSVGTGDAAKNANPNKANALYAILFEAISLALQHDADKALLTTCVGVLGGFLTAKEPNVKYLALETLARLALVPDILEAIRHHQATVVASLKDADVSIRKRSMDLLFTMCDASCSEELVRELLAYLVVADFSIREELVLKVAILAEKFAPNVQWYVDVALELLEKAGDFVSEEVWHRVVQLVTNNPAMQQYAARNVVDTLRRGASHESLVCAGSYILGEFGRLVAADVPARDQFQLLLEFFPAATQATKGLLLTAFIKIYLMDAQNAEFKTEVLSVFERLQKYMDAELQQRASEYLRIAANPQAASQHYFLPMPKWEERESSLLRRLQQTEGSDADTIGAYAAAAAGTTTGSGVLSTTPSGNAPSTTTSPSRTGTLGSGGAQLPSLPQPPGGSGQAPPPPQVDLLGGDTPNGTAVAPALPSVASNAAAPKSTNPVDILPDLLGDSRIGGGGATGVAVSGATSPPPPGVGAATPATATASPVPAAAVAAGAVAGAAAAGAVVAAVGQQQQQQQLPPGAAAFGAPPLGSPPPYAGYTGAAPPPAQAPPPPPYAGYTGAAPPPPPYAGYTGTPGGPPPPHLAAGPYAGFTGAPPPFAGYTGAPAPPGAPYAGYTGAPPGPPPLGAPYGGYTGAQQPLYAGYTGTPPPQQQPPYAGPTGALQSYPSQQQQQHPLPLQPVTSYGGYAGGPQQQAGPMGSGGVGAGGGVVQPLGSLEAWFNTLLVKDRGILYEDPHLQVGLQARYTRGTGQVVLFLGNKNKEAALTSLVLQVGSAPAGLQVLLAAPPPSLAPGQQLQVVVQVAALAPFAAAPPQLLLAYQLAGGPQVRQELRLPVVPHKFCVPEPAIGKDFFFDQWKTWGNPPAKAQDMVDRSQQGLGPLGSPSVVAVLRQANLGVEHAYLDPSPFNEAGAAYFVCGQPGGPEQAILVMARVEGNPQNMAQFRITVASAAPPVSAAVKDLVVAHLRTTA